MKFDIRNRFSGEIQFSAEIECTEDEKTLIKIGLAMKWAIKTGANLTGADLTDAYLTDAYLADAYLARANLARADLAGAYLARANLAGANLTGADLAGANLTGADLARADLARANLTGANLTGADLARANLAGANLTGADLAGANLAGANLTGAYLTDAYLADAYLARANLAGAAPENIPVIPKIDAVILAEIEKGGTLDMSIWHGSDGWCGTTHCRAGWAVHCAGHPGRELELKFGTQLAAALIYRASRPGHPIPWFFAPNEKALDDIRKCAAEQSAGET
jgi:uncharacterized protein YjbI with pentapeptide repeats